MALKAKETLGREWAFARSNMGAALSIPKMVLRGNASPKRAVNSPVPHPKSTMRSMGVA